MRVKEMSLELVLRQTLLADGAEVVCLVGLSDEEVGVGLEIVGSHLSGGGRADQSGPVSLQSDPRHLYRLKVGWVRLESLSITIL